MSGGRRLELRLTPVAIVTSGSVDFLLEEKPEVRCVLKIGGMGIRLTWEGMLDIARLFHETAAEAEAARCFIDVLLAGVKKATIDPHVARDLFAVGATRIARRAEELIKHSQVAHDGAILIRAGVPVGLAVDPRVRAEAAHAAVNDSDLRRYMPGGVRSTMLPMPPTIIRHQPTASQKALHKAWKSQRGTNR